VESPLPKEKEKKRSNKKLLLLALLAMIPVITASAAVFVYYPMNVSIQQQAPPVVFALGSDANKADLGGQTITVSLGANQTSATLTLHPTYQTAYYQDILHIKNTGSSSYNAYLRISTPLSLPSGGTASLIVHLSNGTNASISLTSSGTVSLGSIASGNDWQIDLQIYIPEGNPTVSTSASISIIYTPESGVTPP